MMDLRHGCIYPILGFLAMLLIAKIIADEQGKPVGFDCYGAVERIYKNGERYPGEFTQVEEQCPPEPREITGRG